VHRFLDVRIRRLQRESADFDHELNCKTHREGHAAIKSDVKCSSRRTTEPTFNSGTKFSMEKARNDTLEGSRRRIKKLICLSLFYVLVAFALLTFSTVEVHFTQITDELQLED